MKVQINLKAVERAAEQSFKEACYLLGNEFTRVISEPGAFPGFPGDIVDSGQMRASQQLDFPDLGEARFTWNTEYSLYVHEGVTLKNGKTISGRPWTKLGLERFNLPDSYAKILEVKLS